MLLMEQAREKVPGALPFGRAADDAFANERKTRIHAGMTGILTYAAHTETKRARSVGYSVLDATLVCVHAGTLTSFVLGQALLLDRDGEEV